MTYIDLTSPSLPLCAADSACHHTLHVLRQQVGFGCVQSMLCGLLWRPSSLHILPTAYSGSNSLGSLLYGPEKQRADQHREPA